MTDRIKAFTVILDSDIREDDAKDLIIAIGSIRRVISVRPHISNNLDSDVATERVRREMIDRIWDVLNGR